MNEKLKGLYQSVILKHDKAPKHYCKLEEATHQIKAYNALCGDRFIVYMKISEDDVIEAISFDGHGCAISKASTSVLVQHLQNKSKADAIALCEEFFQIVKSSFEVNDKAKKEEFEAFSVAKDFPGRLQCATLAWDELFSFLETKD